MEARLAVGERPGNRLEVAHPLHTVMLNLFQHPLIRLSGVKAGDATSHPNFRFCSSGAVDAETSSA
jgi:hypothetical protein